MRRLNQISHFSLEPAFNSFESLWIDLDAAFHMHRIDLFNSAHVNFLHSLNGFYLKSVAARAQEFKIQTRLNC